MLTVNEHGHIEQIHYGKRICISDAHALRYKRTIPYGSEIMYSQSDGTYCLDNVPLNWSGIGKGDFRITPFEAEMPDGSYTSDFTFLKADIRKGTYQAKTLPCAYDDEEDTETLVLYMKDSAFAVGLELIYTVYYKENVITRRAVLANAEEKPVIIRRMMSLLIDLQDRSYKMITLDGDWIKEAHRHDRKLMPGCFINESTTGSSSNRHNPGVILAEENASEDRGEVYGFNLVYSGNHYTAVELSTHGFVRVVSGINPLCFSWSLKSGEKFETPESLLTFSDGGFNGMSHNFHDFINSHIVRGFWKDKERPTLLNDWEACFFKFTRRKLISLARRAKKLGIEMFVLDDGWFGERDSDTKGLGDYNVNTKKLPGGIKALADKITKTGLLFGLWFEPESVNTDSDLYRAHPEYAVKLPSRTPSFGRNQLLLDLTKKEVRDYIVKSVGDVLDSAKISYVKWDMNRHMSDIFSDACPSGEFFHRYILGLYEVLSRIFRPRPRILLESCSSGGNRFDLGMLCFSPQIWASDDTDPIERLKIQTGLSYFYPPSTMGAHVSQAPHQQTLRRTPLSTRFNVAAFGDLGYELDPTELSPEENREIAAQVSFYKKYRHTFQFGRFYRYDSERENSAALLSVEKDRETAVMTFIRTLTGAAEDGDVLSVKGLDEKSGYIFKSVPQRLFISGFGGLLKHLLPVKLPEDGFIFRLLNRHYTLKDGETEFSASGAALSAGVKPGGAFVGTGYDKNLRMWGDYGSQMYTVNKIKNKKAETKETSDEQA